MSREMKECPRCGRPSLAKARFCHLCGAPLTGDRPPSRSLPTPDRASLNRPCTVIHAGGEEMDVRRIGRCVAEAVGEPLPDVTRKLRTSKGILATGLAPDLAIGLAERIERELRTSVLVIPDESCVPLQPAMRMRHVALDSDGLICEAYTWDRTDRVRAGWDQVFLVSCARVELQEVVEERHESGNARDFVSRRVPDLVTHTHHEFLLDMILFGPSGESSGNPSPREDPGKEWRRLRLDQNTVAFSLTEMRQDPAAQVGPLYRSAVNLERFAQGVPMNRGVPLLSSGAGNSAWESLTFLNKRDFDSYTYWVMQLVRYGQPISG